MRTIFTLCAFFLLFAAAAQTQPFIKYYGARPASQGSFAVSSDYSYGVTQTSDSGFAFTGVSVFYDTLNPISVLGKMMLYKTDKDGNELWQKEIALPGCSDANGYKVRELPGGDLLIAGTCHPALYLMRTDKNGQPKWTRNTGIIIGFARMEVTPDGGCIVAGNESNMMKLAKFDKDGLLVWQKTYNYQANQFTSDVKRTADGGYILAGYCTPPTWGNSWAYLVKTNAQGDTLWTRSIQDTTIGEVRLESVTQTKDGGYMASGGIVAAGSLFRFDASGQLQWHLYTPGTPAYGVYEDSGKAWYAFVFNNYQLGLQKIAYAGDTIRWTKIYTHLAPNYAAEMQRTKEGGFILTGYGANVAPTPGSFSTVRAILIKTDGDGEVVQVHPTAIGEEKMPEAVLDIYPNPATDMLHIRSNQAMKADIMVNNMLGQAVGGSRIEGHSAFVRLAHLPAGLYTISITGADGHSYVRKICKQ